MGHRGGGGHATCSTRCIDVPLPPHAGAPSVRWRGTDPKREQRGKVARHGGRDQKGDSAQEEERERGGRCVARRVKGAVRRRRGCDIVRRPGHCQGHYQRVTYGDAALHRCVKGRSDWKGEGPICAAAYWQTGHAPVEHAAGAGTDEHAPFARGGAARCKYVLTLRETTLPTARAIWAHAPDQARVLEEPAATPPNGRGMPDRRHYSGAKRPPVWFSSRGLASRPALASVLAFARHPPGRLPGPGTAQRCRMAPAGASVGS